MSDILTHLCETDQSCSFSVVMLIGHCHC